MNTNYRDEPLEILDILRGLLTYAAIAVGVVIALWALAVLVMGLEG